MSSSLCLVSLKLEPPVTLSTHENFCIDFKVTFFLRYVFISVCLGEHDAR